MLQIAELLGDRQLVRQLGMPPDHLVERIRTSVYLGEHGLVLDLLAERFLELVQRYVEVVRNREVRHQRFMLERVFLDLSGDLGRRGQSLRMIGEQRGHLLG